MTPEGWKTRTLESLAEYHNGRAFKPQDWGTHGLPIIRIAQITNPSAETNYYSGNDIENRHLITNGDLLFSWSATLAVILWDRGPAVVNQHIFKVVEKAGVDRLFLKYLLDNSIDALADHSHGSTMKHIKKGVLKDFIAGIPPLPEQKKIAAILGSVDEAIQATQAVIDQTRKVKKGLLQQLLTRGIGHTRFKKTEIGEIPEEWAVVRLQDLLSESIRNGYSPVCPKSPTGTWILSLGAVNPEGFKAEAVKPAPENDPRVLEFMLRPGDFLVSRSNTRERVGFSSLYRGEIENCSYPDLLMRFRVDNLRILNVFMEQYLASPIALAILQNAASGTSGSMVKINKKILESLPIPVPPLQEQRHIAGILHSSNNALDHDNDVLTSHLALKNGLMQDLLTGRVRVKGVA